MSRPGQVLQIQTPEWALPLLSPARYKGAHGGRGCVHPDTPIDTPGGCVKVSEFRGGFVYALHDGQIVNAWATAAVAYDVQDLYDVTLEDGRSISVTDQHRFLTARGWVQCCDLSMTDAVAVAQYLGPPVQPQTSSGTDPCACLASAHHLTDKARDCQDDCFLGRHQDDALPLCAINTDPVLSPLLACVLPHIAHALRRLDALGFLHTDNPLPLLYRLASCLVDQARVARNCEVMGSCIADRLSALLWQWCLVALQSRGKSILGAKDQEFSSQIQDCDSLTNQGKSLEIGIDTPKREICDIPSLVSSCYHDRPILIKIKSICKRDRLIYWDLHVPGYENYLSNGIVNHNSGKSHFFAELMVEHHIINQSARSVCIREVQKSLDLSVKRLLQDKITRLNAGAYFDVQDKVIKSASGGGLIIFQGMQNHTAESIKSLEGFDIAWVEEAQSLSDHSLELLRPTMRKESGAAQSEMWFSWNPENETDAVDQLLRGKMPPPGAIVIEVNYLDNPWMPKSLQLELEYDRKRDPDKFAHVWLGRYRKQSQALVFKNWRVEEFDTPPDAMLRFGADWGFAIDPTVLVRCFTVGRKLYVDYEAYKVGCEIADTPSLFLSVPDSERWPIVADSSRPETISHVRNNGFPKIQKAVKGPGSLKDGIEFLKSYDIIVHTRCKRTITELKSYKYKVDKDTKEITNMLEDEHNHVIDALRYACEATRRARKESPKIEVLPMVNHWGANERQSKRRY